MVSLLRSQRRALTTCTPDRQRSIIGRSSSGGSCRSTSIGTTASPRDAFRPALSAASLPKLRDSWTSLTRLSPAHSPRSTAAVASVLPSSTKMISSRGRSSSTGHWLWTMPSIAWTKGMTASCSLSTGTISDTSGRVTASGAASKVSPSIMPRSRTGQHRRKTRPCKGIAGSSTPWVVRRSGLVPGWISGSWLPKGRNAAPRLFTPSFVEAVGPSQSCAHPGNGGVIMLDGFKHTSRRIHELLSQNKDPVPAFIRFLQQALLVPAAPLAHPGQGQSEQQVRCDAWRSWEKPSGNLLGGSIFSDSQQV